MKTHVNWNLSETCRIKITSAELCSSISLLLYQKIQTVSHNKRKRERHGRDYLEPQNTKKDVL